MSGPYGQLSAAADPYRIAVPVAAVNPGDVWKLRNGLAGLFTGTSGLAAGVPASIYQSGFANFVKPTGICFLDGGDVYWNTGATPGVNFKKVNGQQDFYLGKAYGNGASTDTTLTVQLNVGMRGINTDLDLLADPYTPSPLTGTAAAGGFGEPRHRGGLLDFVLTATNQVQCIGALSQASFLYGSRAIVEIIFNVIAPSGSTAVTNFFGLSNASHATDPTANTQYVFCTLDSNDAKINFQTKDGTTTVAKTDSTLTYTAGTPKEIWIDMRNPAAVAFYVDGVQALSSTTFNINAAAIAWKLLAWLGKTSSTDTYEVELQRHRVRYATQSLLSA